MLILEQLLRESGQLGPEGQQTSVGTGSDNGSSSAYLPTDPYGNSFGEVQIVTAPVPDELWNSSTTFPTTPTSRMPPYNSPNLNSYATSTYPIPSGSSAQPVTQQQYSQPYLSQQTYFPVQYSPQQVPYNTQPQQPPQYQPPQYSQLPKQRQMAVYGQGQQQQQLVRQYPQSLTTYPSSSSTTTVTAPASLVNTTVVNHNNLVVTQGRPVLLNQLSSQQQNMYMNAGYYVMMRRAEMPQLFGKDGFNLFDNAKKINPNSGKRSAACQYFFPEYHASAYWSKDNDEYRAAGGRAEKDGILKLYFYDLDCAKAVALSVAPTFGDSKHKPVYQNGKRIFEKKYDSSARGRMIEITKCLQALVTEVEKQIERIKKQEGTGANADHTKSLGMIEWLSTFKGRPAGFDVSRQLEVLEGHSNQQRGGNFVPDKKTRAFTALETPIRNLRTVIASIPKEIINCAFARAFGPSSGNQQMLQQSVAVTTTTTTAAYANDMPVTVGQPMQQMPNGNGGYPVAQSMSQFGSFGGVVSSSQFQPQLPYDAVPLTYNTRQ